MTIRLLHLGNTIQIRFQYNSTVVKIMRSFQAKYYKSTKTWTIPKERLDDLKEELTFQGFVISEPNTQNYKVIRDKMD